MKYTHKQVSVLRDLNAKLGGHLSQEEADTLELAADAIVLLARAEMQNNYGAFVHRVRKDKGQAPMPVGNYSITTLECPACGAWIEKESRLRHSPDELLRCMQIAVNCSKGADIDCDRCPVALIPHNAALDCDGAMLQEAINLIDRLISGEIRPNEAPGAAEA